MKNLMLISVLCLLASCADKDKKSQLLSKTGEPTQSLIAPEIEQNSGQVIIPVVVENEIIIEESAENMNEDQTGDNSEPVEVINLEAKSLVCDFVNENEQSTLSLLIKDKNVVLKDSKSDAKLTFDRHIFSPSGNENATVHHEDKDFSVSEGKVIKITSRLLMSEDHKTGELQVSYRVKTEGNKTVQTEFVKLADINNCTQE